MRYLFLITLFLFSCGTAKVGHQYNLCTGTNTVTVSSIKGGRVCFIRTGDNSRKPITVCMTRKEFRKEVRRCN